MKELEWSQQFSHNKSMGIFLRCSRAANSIIGHGILKKFKLIQAFKVDLLICKYEKELFKIEST